VTTSASFAFRYIFLSHNRPWCFSRSSPWG